MTGYPDRKANTETAEDDDESPTKKVKKETSPLADDDNELK